MASRLFSTLKSTFAAAVTAAALLLAQGSASGDVGVTNRSPAVAAPGDQVSVTVKAASSISVPNGAPNYPLSLVPVNRAPAPCRPAPAPCPMPKAPPRSPPYTYLGLAKRLPGSNPVKTYRLRFRVPQLKPGTYVFVIFNHDLRSPGSRGGLVVSSADRVDRLRVVAGRADGVGPPHGGSGPGDSLPWAFAGVAVVVLALGSTILIRRGRRVRAQL